MTKLIISALVLVTGLAGASLAATDHGSNPGTNNTGMCRPTETNLDPCGTGWTQPPAHVQFHVHHHDKVTSHSDTRKK